jgi:enoyl-CoA hydratase/carnithine racemase
MFSARLMAADEAFHMGLVNRVCEIDELEGAVRDYAALITANAPLTVKAAKAAINEAVKDPSSRDLESISIMINACFDSDDYKEGRAAFKEKRKPAFKGC